MDIERCKYHKCKPKLSSLCSNKYDNAKQYRIACHMCQIDNKSAMNYVNGIEISGGTAAQNRYKARKSAIEMWNKKQLN